MTVLLHVLIWLAAIGVVSLAALGALVLWLLWPLLAGAGDVED